MKIGPKYKIARRLRAPIFEKTQTQKYSLREESRSRRKSFRPKTDYGLQLNEKQKARMFYSVTEKQFAKYVKEAIHKKSSSPIQNLLRSLESRLDNVAWRAGLLPTHLAARQAISHGHLLVNGKKVYVPSFSVKNRDVISIREGSKSSRLWSDLSKRVSETKLPQWLVWNPEKMEILVKNILLPEMAELLFDVEQVIEYYQR